MADFTIDVSRSKTSRINLGIQGENIIEHIIFNISSWIEEFGDGVAYIYAQRKGDENPYPVALDMDLDAGTATWTITDADTAIKGKGKAQLVFVSDDEDSITDVDVYSSSSTYSVGDYCLYGTQLYKCKTTISTAEAWTPAHWDAVNEVKKTRVYATTVQASLVSTSSENPDAYETWLEVLGGYTARIEAVEGELKEWVEDYVESNTIEDVKLNGSGIVDARVADIPLANELSDGAMSAEDKEKLDGIESGAEVNVQADWNQSDSTKDDYIKNKPVNATTSADGFMSATDKAKLDGIASGAEVNVQADWNQTDNTADDYIKNKPGNATAYTDGFLSAANKRKLDSIEYSADVTPGVATTTRMGLMSSSDKSKLNGIEAGAEVNVQADWNQTDTTEDDYIKNKPTIPTIPGVATTSTNGLMASTDKAKLNGIEAGADANVQADWNQTDDTEGDYIKNKPTIPDVPDIEGTSPINVDDTTDTLIISHEVSAVTPGAYGGYNGTDMRGYYCFYAPTFTVDDDGHLTFASNLGENVSDVLNPSSSYGFIRKEVWAGAVRAYSNNYILVAGQTSASFDIYDSYSPWTSVGIVDVVAFDASTYEPVMVDWTVDTLASVSIKQPYVTLTVSIAEAYEHDIRIYPTVTYRIIGM